MRSAFIQYLSTYLKSPASIANYVSSVRTYLKDRGLYTSAFNNHRVTAALDAFARQKTHEVHQMAALEQGTIARIVRTLWVRYQIPALEFAIQLIYYAGLRQSEVTPHSKAEFDPTRHPTRDDVRLVDGSLVIRQKWSKTMQRFDQRRTLVLPPSPDNRMCVVDSFKRMQKDTPVRAPAQPLLLFPGSHHIITARWLTEAFRATLVSLGLNQKDYSLHSLRRSAATNAYAGKHDHLQVQRFGAWSSEAYKQYITARAANTVTSALVNSMANK